MPLYAAAAAVAFAVQAVFEFVWPVKHGLLVAESVAVPMLTALVYAFVWTDAGAAEPDERSPWERFLERAWAVIVIDFALAYLNAYALAFALAGDPVAIVIGVLGLIASALLVYADASATVDDANVWLLIPHALSASLRTAWRGRTLVRTLAIFTFIELLFSVEQLLGAWFGELHLPHAEFWGDVPLGTLVTLPLSAVIVLVYRDAAAAARSEP